MPNCSGPLRVAVCSVFLACCATQLARAEQSALLTPTGSYSVGRTFFYLTDPNRADPVAARTGTKREFMVIAWYPAETNTRRPMPHGCQKDGRSARRSFFIISGSILQIP